MEARRYVTREDPEYAMRPAAAKSLAARWRHRADQMERLLSSSPPQTPDEQTAHNEATAIIATYLLCADELTPTADLLQVKP